MAIGFTHLKKRFCINDLGGSITGAIGAVAAAKGIEKIELFGRPLSLVRGIHRDV
jgi:hypothetical protein